MPYEHEMEAARQAAEHAGKEIMALYANFEAIADAPASISTEADRRSQEIILQHLQSAFPHDAFCAEETTATLTAARREGSRLWIVDPIDGTRGFARKNGEFSVMIALVDSAAVALGVVLEPARGRLTYATRGNGCWRQDPPLPPLRKGGHGGVEPAQRCRVSRTEQLPQATLVQSRSDRAKADRSLLQAQNHLYTYSAGIKMAMVARAEADLYVSTYSHFNAWDVCAGQILVEEAGGRVTDALGRVIAYQPDGSGRIQGVVASNGPVHQAALAVLKNV